MNMPTEEPLAVYAELPSDLADAMRSLQSDRFRGAVPLSRDAAILVKRAVSHPALPPWPGTRPFLARLCKALVQVQTTMAPMLTLANRVLWAAEPAEDVASLRHAVVAECEAFDTQIRVSLIRIARLANGLLPENTAVLTHSSSQTILSTIEEACRSGKNPLVYCTESRPQREGVAMAHRLAEVGCRVKVIVDAAVYHVMEQVSVVLVGADAVSEEGVTNKIGTPLLALAAAEKGKPVYALCGSEKWLPAGYPLPKEAAKPSSEVLEESIDGVEALNYYFGTCPLERLTAIVSEEGVLSAADVISRLKELRLHPLLLRT